MYFQVWESDDLHRDLWVPLKDKMASSEAMDDLVELSSGFNTSFLLPFETVDELQFYRWMTVNWTLSIWFSILYVIVIFTGKHLMEKRQRFEIRGPLAIWNIFLAIFSILGAFRMNQELYWSFSQYGWKYTLCTPSYGQVPFGLWVILFTMSKVVELGDTLFIVLRKQPLIFLHWYHHILTMIYVWVTYTERMSSGRWFITMNYTVHAFMYTYYALRAMKFRIPRYVNISITTMQTLQMVVGIVVNTGVILQKKRGEACAQSYGNITLALLMYFSYFLLFSFYFYNAYIAPKPKPPSEKVHKVYQNGVQNGIKNGYANGTKKHN